MNKSLIILPAAVIIIALTGYFTLNNSGQQSNKRLYAVVQTVSKTSVPENKKDTVKSCCSDAAQKSTNYCDNSVYQLESRWSNEFNNKVALGDLKGQKVVMAMIFASCTYACPLIVNDMRKVEAALPEGEKGSTKFVLISIDPERDSPKTLLEYSKKQNLDLSRWELLTGNKDDIRSLAVLLGFKYKKNENGDYSHSNLINVFNREGEIVFQHEGLNKDIQDIVKELKRID